MNKHQKKKRIIAGIEYTAKMLGEAKNQIRGIE